MKAVIEPIVNLFQKVVTSEKEKIYDEWYRQRAMAITPSDRAEIDAIFSRYV